jgi:hypothetical protein
MAAASSPSPLPLAEWEETQATLHRWVQMVGKTRLALEPPRNHWWHTALYLTPRGLTTSPMPLGEGRTLELEFDFQHHQLRARRSHGAGGSIQLHPQSVADFYAEYLRLLEEMGVQVHLHPVPVEMAEAVPFAQDRTHASYDRAAVERWWRMLQVAHGQLTRFRDRFIGKCSPVHFWWGGFDLACTRFSGRRAPLHPGGIPNTPDRMAHEAYSHECISAGWWPGGGGVAGPAWYAYAYPEPAGCPQAAIQPAAAGYHLELREWILPQEAVDASADPDQAVMDFLQSTWQAAADLGGWDRAGLETPDGWALHAGAGGRAGSADGG